MTFGSFGPPLLTFVRSCHDLGHHCIHCEIVEDTSGRVRSVGLRGIEWFHEAEVGTEAGLLRLEELISAHGVDALATVAEPNHLWFGRNRVALERHCTVLSSDYEVLTSLLGKDAQLRLAEACGFRVLPTWRIAAGWSVDQLAGIEFPVCVRPDHPTSCRPLFKARICRTGRELEDLLGSLTRHEGVLVVQPLKLWPDLKVHGVRSREGEILALRAFLVERKFQGVTLTLMNFDMDPTLRAACAEFAHRAGIVGCFHFDLLFDPDRRQAYFLEINIRMGGVTDKAYRLGYDQPALLLNAFGIGPQSAREPDTDPAVRVVNRRALVRHMLDCVRGRLTDLDYPAVGRLGHLRLSARDMLFARDSVFD